MILNIIYIAIGTFLLGYGSFGLISPQERPIKESQQIRDYILKLKLYKTVGAVKYWQASTESVSFDFTQQPGGFIRARIIGSSFGIDTHIFGQLEKLSLEVTNNDAFLLDNGAVVCASYNRGDYRANNVKETYRFEIYRSKLERALK